MSTNVYANAITIRGPYSSKCVLQSHLNVALLFPEPDIDIPMYTSAPQADVQKWTDEAAQEHARFKDMVQEYVAAGLKRTEQGRGDRVYLNVIIDTVL